MFQDPRTEQEEKSAIRLKARKDEAETEDIVRLQMPQLSCRRRKEQFARIRSLFLRAMKAGPSFAHTYAFRATVDNNNGKVDLRLGITSGEKRHYTHQWKKNERKRKEGKKQKTKKIPNKPRI